MGHRIFFGCAGAPDWGEANAWAYELFARMRGDGLDVVYANLLAEADPFFFRYTCGEHFADPRGLGDVRSCTIEEPFSRDQPRLSELIRSCAPDLLVAWGAGPARLLKKAAPELPLVLVACECEQLERLVEEGAVRDWIGFRKAVERGVFFRVPQGDREIEAVSGCDLLILPTARARFAFEHFFAFATGRTYARTITAADLVAGEAGRFADLRRPFAERDIDVLFAELDWRPRVRNLALANRIAARLPELAVHVVGEHRGLEVRGHAHGAVTRRALFALLGRAKAVAFPSLAEIGMGVAFEAASMGCNVVASEASATVELCAAELRAPACREADLADRIRLAVSRPFGDRRESFAADYADLVETLAVF